MHSRETKQWQAGDSGLENIMDYTLINDSKGNYIFLSQIVRCHSPLDYSLDVHLERWHQLYPPKTKPSHVKH